MVTIVTVWTEYENSEPAYPFHLMQQQTMANRALLSFGHAEMF